MLANDFGTQENPELHTVRHNYQATASYIPGGSAENRRIDLPGMPMQTFSSTSDAHYQLSAVRIRLRQRLLQNAPNIYTPAYAIMGGDARVPGRFFRAIPVPGENSISTRGTDPIVSIYEDNNATGQPYFIISVNTRGMAQDQLAAILNRTIRVRVTHHYTFENRSNDVINEDVTHEVPVRITGRDVFSTSMGWPALVNPSSAV